MPDKEKFEGKIALPRSLEGSDFASGYGYATGDKGGDAKIGFHFDTVKEAGSVSFSGRKKTPEGDEYYVCNGVITEHAAPAPAKA